MKISLQWLREYVDVSSAAEVADWCNARGMEVEGVTTSGHGFDGVVIAEVRSVESLEGSDHLSVCDVFDGALVHTVLCGAPNAAPGRFPWAKPGSRLPLGDVGEKAVRGVVSAGMLVSKKELGLSDDHAGIWRLPEDAPLGALLHEAYPIRDEIVEIDITANRPDLLSIIGVAREIAAATGRPLRKPALNFEAVGGEAAGRVSVRIDAPELCPRYTGMVVEGLSVAPSPIWMQRRLEAVGLRAINNLVDITNYVLFECGQPLHAFDEHFLAGGAVVVRRANEGEIVRTLDEVDRRMAGDEALICDGEKPVAIGGVMGGANSLVADDTTDVFIESAYFAPTSIRRTSTRLGLSTDSSYRFERGIDVDGVPWGLHRAASLMAEFGGGRIVPGCIDVYPAVVERPELRVRTARVNHVLGTELTRDRVAGLLRALELDVTPIDGDAMTVRVPGFRVDLVREIDMIEEVARCHGFENIAATLPPARSAPKPFTAVQRAQNIAREALVGMGYSEVLSLAMTSPDLLDRFHRERGSYVRVQNPLSVEMSALRDSLVPTLCRCVAFNVARRQGDLALFETRRTYHPTKSGELPVERLRVAAAACGRRVAEGWTQSVVDFDFFDLKGAVELLMERFRLSRRVTYAPAADDETLVDGVAALVLLDGKTVGRVGRVSPAILAGLEIDAPVFVFEIDLSSIAEAGLPEAVYKPWSRYPGTTRDLAMVVDRDVAVGPIVEALRTYDPARIRGVEVFDVYQGAGLDEGMKSVAVRLEILSETGTLTAEEIESVANSALKMLSERFSVKLR